MRIYLKEEKERDENCNEWEKKGKLNKRERKREKENWVDIQFSEWETSSESQSLVRWTSAVKVSIIPLALPYFSYGKLYRVVS